MNKKNFLPVIVLVCICMVAALLLALVNTVTAPIIKAAQDAATTEALREVLPDGENFKKLTLDDSYPPAVEEGYRADGGYVFRMSVTGKASGLIIMCGIDNEGKIVGTKVIASSETANYAEMVFPALEGVDGAYRDMELESFEPYLVTKATRTSAAYAEAVKAALQAFEIANGGYVDIRTPEQILEDNCNTALGTAGLTFTKWFATESIEGIDAVYQASDNSGRVYVIGKTFVGVRTDGTIVNLGDADEDVVAAADDAVRTSKLTEVTSLPNGINKTIVKKIYKTASGNYVFELDAAGYQSMVSWGTAVPINIRLSISSVGTILDCLTVSHDETAGIGDVCAADEYYDQFIGASASDIVISVERPDEHIQQIPSDTTDIGAISGATFTAYGYQRAVKAAFDAYQLLIAGGEANV